MLQNNKTLHKYLLYDINQFNGRQYHHTLHLDGCLLNLYMRMRTPNHILYYVYTQVLVGYCIKTPFFLF